MARAIGIFVFPDFQIMDAAGPIAAFEIAGRFADDAYRLVLLSQQGGPVASSSGVLLDTVPAARGGTIDTLLVVGGNGSRTAMLNGETMAFLRQSAPRRMCSVCSGAFLLAAAGLLDGRRATTHWRRAEQLARRFAAVRVEPDRIHIRDGNVWTSAGISAGIDLSLALVADDSGDAVAQAVAREMVVYYRRPGGQSQFSALAELGETSEMFAPLLDWIRANLAQRLTVEVLAEQAGMSPRNFSRAFARTVGVSPARAVERLRLEVARERVENSSTPIEAIARATGPNACAARLCGPLANRRRRCGGSARA
jgi:transcriptional regulator GlxA family with amidase domain